MKIINSLSNNYNIKHQNNDKEKIIKKLSLDNLVLKEQIIDLKNQINFLKFKNNYHLDEKRKANKKNALYFVFYISIISITILIYIESYIRNNLILNDINILEITIQNTLKDSDKFQIISLNYKEFNIYIGALIILFLINFLKKIIDQKKIKHRIVIDIILFNFYLYISNSNLDIIKKDFIKPIYSFKYLIYSKKFEFILLSFILVSIIAQFDIDNYFYNIIIYITNFILLGITLLLKYDYQKKEKQYREIINRLILPIFKNFTYIFIKKYSFITDIIIFLIIIFLILRNIKNKNQNIKIISDDQNKKNTLKDYLDILILNLYVILVYISFITLLFLDIKNLIYYANYIFIITKTLYYINIYKNINFFFISNIFIITKLLFININNKIFSITPEIYYKDIIINSYNIYGRSIELSMWNLKMQIYDKLKRDIINKKNINIIIEKKKKIFFYKKLLKDSLHQLKIFNYISYFLIIFYIVISIYKNKNKNKNKRKINISIIQILDNILYIFIIIYLFIYLQLSLRVFVLICILEILKKLSL